MDSGLAAGGLPTSPPAFRIGNASSALLLGLKSDGPPARTTFDTRRIAQSQSGPSLFRLKTTALPELEPRVRGAKGGASASRHGSTASTAAGLGDASLGTAGLTAGSSTGFSAGAHTGASLGSGPGAVIVAEKPQKRAQKYFDLLMKHHDRRIEGWRKEEEAEENARRENAAGQAARIAIKASTRKKDVSDSETEEEEEEPRDYGQLTAYEGKMKVDLELLVMRAPGEPEEALSEAPPSLPSTVAESTAVSESTPRMDLTEELAALQGELGVEEESDTDSDGLPDDLKNRQVANIWDNPKMRWTLGIGGTVFFVPGAERYAHGPSLPPPPPPSLHGRGRMRLKPRLPLDISNHRYRDEHPNIWPEQPFSPTKEDKSTFEQKLMTLDFYASCSKSMTRLPPLERERDTLRSEVSFGQLVEADTKRSRVWVQHHERRRLRKLREAKKAKEAATAGAAPAATAQARNTGAAAATTQAARQAAEAAGAAGGELEGGPSITSLGMPSESGGPGTELT